MPLAAKIFRLGEKMKPEIAALKLRGLRVEWEEPDVGEALVEEVRGLEYSQGLLKATILKDKPFVYKKRGSLVKTIRTMEVPILIDFRRGDEQLLVVLARKRVANEVAVDLSKMLFGRHDRVLEVDLSDAGFQRYFESRLEDARVVYLDQVDIPSINKLALYGESIKDTMLYREYVAHGKLWYVVVSVPERGGLVVGITRNMVVTSFTRVGVEEFLDFILNDLVNLVLGGGP